MRALLLLPFELLCLLYFVGAEASGESNEAFVEFTGYCKHEDTACMDSKRICSTIVIE